MALARLPEIATVEQVVAPRLLDTLAREILGIPRVADPPLGLEGDGQIIGIADTGLDGTHPFAGRVIDIKAWGRPGPPPDHSDPEGHGTHVAGCATGNGAASGGEVKGAAPKAKIFFQSILDANGRLGGLPEDLGDLFDEAYKGSGSTTTAGARSRTPSIQSTRCRSTDMSLPIPTCWWSLPPATRVPACRAAATGE